MNSPLTNGKVECRADNQILSRFQSTLSFILLSDRFLHFGYLRGVPGDVEFFFLVYGDLFLRSGASSTICTQFNQQYLVQLVVPSSTSCTQFNQLYLVQLAVPSSNQWYLVQPAVPSSTSCTYLVLAVSCSTTCTQFNYLYPIQLSVPSSTICTQFNFLYLVQQLLPFINFDFIGRKL